ncbi:MAG: LD-carboxypeptidase [Rickettsiaceae bacterium]|nr:LD-carboxypeptidase [Rickettsiaceae bacterium]
MIKVKLIAPSSGLSQDPVGFLSKATSYLKSQGVHLIYEDGIFAGNELPFFASSQEFMVKNLVNSLESDEYEILWAARGGYGCANLLEQVSRAKINGTKILVGFSDITALHILMNEYFGVESIHGPALSSFMKYEQDFSIIINTLNSPSTKYFLKKISNFHSSNQITGKIIGGNLTVLESLIGTKFQPNLQGKILLLEDIGERPYRIHRSLMHMKNANLLEGCSAIIFADFLEKNNDITEQDMKEVIIHFCNNEVKIPCFFTNRIGHGSKNLPIILNRNAKISHKHNDDVILDVFIQSKN